MATRPKLKLHHVLALLLAAGLAYRWWPLPPGDDEPGAAADTAAGPATAPASTAALAALAPAVQRCHALWLAGHWDQAPLALAWQPGRLDWYVEEGVDRDSMRHFHCDGVSMQRGARYRRVLAERLPPPSDEPRLLLRDLNLFTHYAQAAADDGLLALEAAQDPQDPTRRPPIERRWTAAGARPSGPAAADFALLLQTGLPAAVAAAAATTASAASTLQPPPPLQPLQPRDWLRRPQEAFALLGDHVPPASNVAAIDLRESAITLTIVGPIPNFDGKPPAPYGDASFDEYGVRDTSWWYPRDDGTQRCTVGRPLDEVRALYLQQPAAADPAVWAASYGCDGRGDERGRWTLRLPRRR
ncbi:MAG: hypothetical protein LCI02_29165 [Proteobacteria bacterium]|nr:hypothetical protein [Pseudomonadota bacterium]